MKWFSDSLNTCKIIQFLLGSTSFLLAVCFAFERLYKEGTLVLEYV